MQAPIMATPPVPPNQQHISQSTTPFQPQTDVASSPSISNNPPPQPPPPMLPYASINQQPYISNAPAGPSNYPNHPSSYMYSPAYHPQPTSQPRHAQNIPYHSGLNRFQDQYQHQPHYPPVYQPNVFGSYSHIPLGAGGPGPTTIQHGYGGYPPEAYQHSPYTVYPPTYPAPPDAAQQYPPQHNGHDDNEIHNAHHYSRQNAPPPFSLSHDQQHPVSVPHVNGNVPASSQHQSFQPSYPPDHPYAFGVGVGYTNYSPNPVPYGGYPGYNTGLANLPAQGNRMSATKGLNPAAQGFSYPSSHPGSRSNSQPSVPLQNGYISTSSAPKSEQKSAFPSIGQIIDTPPTPSLPNGNAEPTEAWKPPVIVDGEKLKGIGGHQPPSSASQGLGLTTEKRRSPSPQLSNPNLSTSTITSESTPAASTVHTTATTPTSVETPRATEGDMLHITSPKSGSSSRVQPDAGWTFGGEVLAGLTSPPTGATSRSTSGPSIRNPSGSSGKKKTSTYSTQTGPLRLSATRPVAEGSSGNFYALGLAKWIPFAVKTEEVSDVVWSKPGSSTKGKSKASGKKVVFTTGTNNKATQIAKTGTKGLIFGSTTEEDRQAAVGPCPTLPMDVIHPPSAPDAKNVTSPRIETATPQAKPVIKPFSWAAAVRGPSTTAGSSVPTVAQSKPASPARSTISLGPEGEAGPSRTPASPPANVTPPRPATSSSQPPLSTGTSTTAGPRPAFNYAAAAAAAGASLTPQEDLARLLADGVKGKGKEGQATIPRGLINTGNMCFANTILQVLVYCAPFTELFEELGKRLKADLARRTPLLEAMIIFLREFNAPFPPPGAATPNGNTTSGTVTPKGKGKDSRREAFIPENVYDAMKENKRFDSMRRGHQEDAEEYLGFFLNTLHEELLLLLSRTQSSRTQSITNGASANGEDHDRQIERPVSPGAGDDAGWLEVGKKQKTHVVRNTETRESAITRLFGGTLRSLLHTPGQKDSATLEPYQPLQLDIQAPNVLDITDALKHIAEPEIVPGVWSAARGANVDATKQVYIESFPQILILHLKRFVYDPVERAVVKRNKPVGYGTELIIPPEIISPGRRRPSGIKYKLFGVVYHHGVSASGGHYTVSVSRQDDKGWIHFDDENVTNVPKEDVVVSREEVDGGRTGLVGGREKTAYLLFYQRVR
ncbi:hypothetical protein IAR55_006299 [Kwoniella newhampshirensis]|uniref:ubiquitinyl hydrolase 1 n=1 Tax=Kwoniella newhampshirensis TaxID=1651941 RepID=A0AAW0YY07_9TREE